MRNRASGGHCEFPATRRNNHDCCVNSHRKGGIGHYEWRLPEPMEPDHFDLLCGFLARFVRDAEDAHDYVCQLVTERDERITAYRRAKECDKFNASETKFEPETQAEDLLWKMVNDEVYSL